MKIAIHHSKNSFSENWINYCKEKSIPFKIVNCYNNNIISDLDDCDALMWHFHQANSKDVLFAKQLLYSLQMAGKKVFPDFNTCWHFDDKVGQKYLLEAIGAPLVPSYVFYDKSEALEWVNQAEFPKVFKLRRGAGSSHVKLVKDKRTAKSIIRKAFAKGFSQYDAVSNLKERWRKFRQGDVSMVTVAKGIARLAYTTDFDRITGREKGYVYFQDFIPNNKFDIRVIVINKRAFAIKRKVRKNDFRASGSGIVSYDKVFFNKELIKLSFDVSLKIRSQCLAIDYVLDCENPRIVEISYGFVKEVYYDCEGYWDVNLNWHRGEFNAQSWMVDDLVENIKIGVSCD